jgi:hypothetical protein
VLLKHRSGVAGSINKRVIPTHRCQPLFYVSGLTPKTSKVQESRPIMINESLIPTECHFTACASLAALGVQLRHLNLFGPIQEAVLIAQKTVEHSPIDKLYDAFISLLAGYHGLVEINTRLRSDLALQAVFGRSRCAEQSVAFSSWMLQARSSRLCTTSLPLWHLPWSTPCIASWLPPILPFMWAKCREQVLCSGSTMPLIGAKFR